MNELAYASRGILIDKVVKPCASLTVSFLLDIMISSSSSSSLAKRSLKSAVRPRSRKDRSSPFPLVNCSAHFLPSALGPGRLQKVRDSYKQSLRFLKNTRPKVSTQRHHATKANQSKRLKQNLLPVMAPLEEVRNISASPDI